MEPTPIHIVREDGRVERLGEWRHDLKTLELERLGFPFLGVGKHHMPGDLPWLFNDICPSGYLGRMHARTHISLELPHDPDAWSPEQKLTVISRFGNELAGNLIVGLESFQLFQRVSPPPGVDIDLFDDIGSLFDPSVEAASSSSLGGERPKLVTAGLLIKFSPPLDTVSGRRWADLLQAEFLCSETLRTHSISAALTRQTEAQGRAMLPVLRFDRTLRGRVGAATLRYLSLERFSELDKKASEMLRRLADEGDLELRDVETMSRVDAFSAAIGNNDNHLGNCSLLFDERGRASLAPIYDVLPMILAPRYDELPDKFIKPRAAPIDPRVESWVHMLVRRVENDPVISQPFKDLWRAYIGA